MTAREVIADALRMSYAWNRMLADDLRDASLAFPTRHGGNHATWVVGHAAAAQAGLRSFITGEPSELAGWDATLGGDSEPSDDASVYPPYDTLLATWEREHGRTLALLASLDDAALDEAPRAVPAELSDTPQFQSVGRLFMFIASHEMSHRGQLADARRALGRSRLAF